MLTGNTFTTLIAGLLAIAGVSGIGRQLLRPWPALPLHWYVALSMLAGMAACSLLVQLLAMLGAGQSGFATQGALIVILGLIGHFLPGKRWTAMPWPPKQGVVTALWIVLALAAAILLLISLAPSSKMDELYYHMLIGQRIAADHQLRVYQLPYEQAILVQIGYQIAQTPFHAWGVMDGGNVLSLGFALALLLMLYGTVADETDKPELGLIAALAGAVGLYPAVWHVTAGPHALGDLATFTAIAALLFPGKLAQAADEAGAQRRALVCILAAACAASTKISLIPISAMLSACACWQLPRTAWPRVGLAAAAIWGLILGPLMIWSFVHTHSPFGAAFAGVFAATTYGPEVAQAMDVSRMAGRLGLGTVLYNTALRLNGLSIVIMLLGALACWRSRGMHRLFLIMILVQIGLIAALLPYDYRFLGGLQYGLLAAGMIAIAPHWPRPGLRLAAIALLAPWLVAEAIYALPMMGVSLGLTTRAAFVDRYVAFAADFRALDRVLPPNAVLYVPERRIPSVYAPRPVITDRADWDHRSPLFAFTYDETANSGCGAVVYRNPAAVVQVFRTPGRPSYRAPLTVTRCAP